jgi:hypothetical protein
VAGGALRRSDRLAPGTFTLIWSWVVRSSRRRNSSPTLPDINATSGIQTQAYATSVLTTLHKGLTTLEIAGYTVWTGTTWRWRGPPANAVEQLSLRSDPATEAAVRLPALTGCPGRRRATAP